VLEGRYTASAKRVLTDNGLNIVSGAAGVTGLWKPNPNFSKNLDAFKKRCEQFADLGAPLAYSLRHRSQIRVG
jgi:hypothetical protein